MRRIAIVGVEGSGKTVMLAGLGELYSRPDEDGYFLAPKNYSTVRYVNEKIAKMRTGEWPMATAEDQLQSLDWILRRKLPESRPENVCSLSCLDFAGEVYRAAFCSNGPHTESAEEVTLKRYIDECDDLIVLINLRDVIANGLKDNRVHQSMWITNEILAYALNGSRLKGRQKRAAIVLSQADSYMGIIESCGGAAGTLEKYLPHVYNSYDWLDIFEASAVDKVRMDDEGNIYPHPDFQPTLLQPIMDWIKEAADEDGFEDVAPLASVASLAESIAKAASSDDFYLKGHSPNAKLSNAMSAMKVRESSGDVFLQFDGTVFGSAAEGLLITSKAIYGKDLWADPFRVPLNSDFTVGHDSGNLLFHWSEESAKYENSVLMAGLSDSIVDEIARLITEWRKGRYEN